MNNSHQTRQQRGYEIAQTSRITKNDKGEWKVPSQTGTGPYLVVSNGWEVHCSCPDHELGIKPMFCVESQRGVYKVSQN